MAIDLRPFVVGECNEINVSPSKICREL